MADDKESKERDKDLVHPPKPPKRGDKDDDRETNPRPHKSA